MVGGCFQKNNKDILLYEIEINSLRENIRNIPSFVAYGRYTVRFFLNSYSGKFKLYKMSDTVYIHLDGGNKFVLPLEMVEPEDFLPKKVSLAGDTLVVEGKKFYLKTVSDRIVEVKANEVYIRFNDYSYEPVAIPRRWLIRYMGATITLNVDSVEVIY